MKPKLILQRGISMIIIKQDKELLIKLIFLVYEYSIKNKKNHNYRDNIIRYLGKYINSFSH